MKKLLITQPKITLINNSLLKVIALIFGYTFWLIFAQNQTLEITQNIPLSFYLTNNEFTIKSPEAITIALSGKRSDLQKLDPRNLGVNIDASHLTQAGIYPITINLNHILLPNYVKLLYYTPVMINLELS